MAKFLVRYIYTKEVPCEAVVEAEDIQSARDAVHEGRVLEECEVGNLESVEIDTKRVMIITDIQFEDWKIKNHNKLNEGD